MGHPRTASRPQQTAALAALNKITGSHATQMNMGRSPATIRIAKLLPMHTVTCSHLIMSCIRQIARKFPRVCQPLDSQLASQTYMYFIIQRKHKLGKGYPCFYTIMLCFVTEKLQKLQSGWGSAPDPDGGAYSAPPYPLAGREGATPPPAPTLVLNQFHLIAFPNPPVSRPAYGPGLSS